MRAHRRVHVRPHVCLSVRSHSTHSKIHQVFFACYLWPWLIVSHQAALRYVMYFRFMDDVVLAHGGPYEGVKSPSHGVT